MAPDMSLLTSLRSFWTPPLLRNNISVRKGRKWPTAITCAMCAILALGLLLLQFVPASVEKNPQAGSILAGVGSAGVLSYGSKAETQHSRSIEKLVPRHSGRAGNTLGRNGDSGTAPLREKDEPPLAASTVTTNAASGGGTALTMKAAERRAFEPQQRISPTMMRLA